MFEGHEKIELHAHLHGSIPLKVLKELAIQQNHKEALEALNEFMHDSVQDLNACFRIFDVIHMLVQTKESLYYITCKVIEEFARDNVVYLELRMTPRATSSFSCTEYMETVIRGIEDSMERFSNIIVKILVSINRANGITEAQTNIQLASQFPKHVIGLDFSGNPHKGRFDDYKALLNSARTRYGFKITIHCGEIVNDAEVMSMLDFKPDRLGHALYMSDEIFEKVHHLKIPIEVCPTSNCKTLGKEGIHEHPRLDGWIRIGHPICICTDDLGIFQTSLSNEIQTVSDSFKVPTNIMHQILHATADYCFSDTATKQRLQKLCKL